MSDNKSKDPARINANEAKSAEIPDEQLKEVSGAGYGIGGSSVKKDEDVKVKVKRDGYGLGG